MLGQIYSQYGLDESEYTVKPFGNGLINHTWKVISAGREWLLQKINHQIFKRPGDIMENCSILSAYFKLNHPDYLFVGPVSTFNNKNYVTDEDHNYYRLFHFINNSFTCDTVSKPSLAFEAARQFGLFTRLLSKFDAEQLLITLPDFHNLNLRQQQFESAILHGNKERIQQTAESITYLRDQKEIVETYRQITGNPFFEQRVVHHDAKINNVLFSLGTDKALCVIDLDTVMPGYFISDVGDMLRTYLSPINEDDPDFGRIEIRESYFTEIAKGYLGEMKSVLSEEEKKYFVYAGKFAIYMQAIRFLSDYLNNDIYYSIQHPEHNLVRANNQIVLLKRFIEKESALNEILRLLEY